MEDELKRKRFLWGVALAWAPWIPVMVGLRSAFAGISNTKATGLAAIAGSFAEVYVMAGLAGTIISEAVALTFLFRAFSPGHGGHTVLSVLSIVASSLMILLFCLSIWTFWFLRHHMY